MIFDTVKSSVKNFEDFINTKPLILNVRNVHNCFKGLAKEK